MTAGGVATLCLTERYLHGHEMVRPGKKHVSSNLRKGLRWLDENFKLDDPSQESDPYYYYWTIQRVGTATEPFRTDADTAERHSQHHVDRFLQGCEQ